MLSSTKNVDQVEATAPNTFNSNIATNSDDANSAIRSSDLFKTKFSCCQKV